VVKVIVMSCVFYTYVCAAVCVINDVLRDWFRLTVRVIIIRLQCTPTTRHTDFFNVFPSTFAFATATRQSCSEQGSKQQESYICFFLLSVFVFMASKRVHYWWVKRSLMRHLMYLFFVLLVEMLTSTIAVMKMTNATRTQRLLAGLCLLLLVDVIWVVSSEITKVF